jgi:hypothetical protein
MDPRPFYTRSPRLAFLRALVEAHAHLDFDRTDFATLFRAVDDHCSAIFPTEDRGNWFSPVFLGGAGINHTPPHIIHAVYAIYSDLIAGSPDPVPFLAQKLDMNGTTALQLDPAEGYKVESCDGESAPMTDMLIRIPAQLPEQWISDIYGIPGLRDDVTRVGWNMAADSLPTAICGGYLLLHQESQSTLDPLSASFTSEQEESFFTEPVHEGRLERYRDRIAELLGDPLDVLKRNHDNARRVLEAYLAAPDPRG